MEQSSSSDNDGFPLGRDYWNKNPENNSYVSEKYESTIHIPFIERTIEINFVNGGSKTITYDSSEYFENPVEENKENIHQEYYFNEFNDVKTFYTPGRYDRLKLHNNNSNDNAEYTITTNNHTYIRLKNEREMVAVIKVSVKDYLHRGISRWHVDELQSIERKYRYKIDELGKRYPTEGAIPHYVDKL